MKALALLFILVFSAPVFSMDYVPFGGDFAPFPLSTGNVALIEGVWRGESVDIQIKDSHYKIEKKPVLWVEINDHKEGNKRHGVIMYDKENKRFQLHTKSSSGSIPLSFEVFKFKSSYAGVAGMNCRTGGTLLKIEFKLNKIFGEVLLTKESCY